MTARTLVEQDGGELVVRIRVEAPPLAASATGAPLLLTRGNVQPLTGLRWRAFDDAMRRLEIPRLKVGGAGAYEAEVALRALRDEAGERKPATTTPADEADPDQSYASVVRLARRASR